VFSMWFVPRKWVFSMWFVPRSYLEDKITTSNIKFPLFSGHCYITAINKRSSASLHMCRLDNSWFAIGNWKVKVMLWPMVSQPVCLGVKPPISVSKARFLSQSESCRFVNVACPSTYPALVI
jgi:hypothetical protein